MIRYAALFSILIAHGAWAQQLLPGDASPTPGEVYVYHSGDYIFPGFTWEGGDMDFTSFTATGSNTRQFVAPSATTYGSSFSTSTVAEVAGPGAWGYYRASTTGFEQMGLATATYDLHCASGTDVVRYPMAYGDMFTDPYSCTGHTGGVPFTRTGEVDLQADGYGTLITPYGTYTNVLRIAIYDTYHDVGSNIDYEGSVSSYLWYKPGIHVPLMGIYDVEAEFVFEQYTWMLDPSSIGVEEALRNGIGLDLFPNPATSSVTIEFGGSGHLVCDLIDDAGRVVRTLDTGDHAPGIYRNEMDLSGLSAGLYTLRATDDHGGIGTKRLTIAAK